MPPTIPPKPRTLDLSEITHIPFFNLYFLLSSASKTSPSLLPINKKPVVATIEELDRNKRARSAKLRVYKKVSDSPSRVFATMEFPQIELGI